MLNRKAFEHAKSLIEAGKVDLKSAWEFTARDENELLGDPPNWERYALWFLFRDPDANPETKGAYKYPYGKDGKVFYRALVAIRARAAQQGEQQIFDAAGRLLNMVREKYAGEFSDETDWVEVFRAGKYPQGEITEEDIDRLVKNYDPTYHEAPVVIGHPSDDAPAYGWVSKLKRVGKSLYAKFRQVADEFRDWVASGRYKKVSVAIYPDLDGKGPYLRHVGFLGAQPPQVKGLAPVKLGEAGEFDEFEMERTGGADMTELEKLKKELAEKEKQIAEFTERIKQLEEQKKSAEQAKAELAKFAEESKKLAQRISELERENKRLALERWLDGLATEGKMIPAFRESGLVDFMLGLDDADGEALMFGEQKTSQLGWFKQFLESLPKSVPFGEQFTDGPKVKDGYKAEGPVDEQRLELHQKALEYMEKHKDADYEAALDAVLSGLK